MAHLEVSNMSLACWAKGELIEKRKLGRDGLEVSAIGFGCMGLNFGYGQALSKEEGVKLIRAAAWHLTLYPRSVNCLSRPR